MTLEEQISFVKDFCERWENEEFSGTGDKLNSLTNELNQFCEKEKLSHICALELLYELYEMRE